ncbi:MAG: prepilin-type N-terminal cleavage/methylation domain-containing protein, partial [Candidatus Riflebacteria bacterium]|nr:prepilin-type N-terminal cleavage/methylation domain-containing protein [Candidatus Riflebacteria bacterium]
MQQISNPSRGFSLTEIMVACLALGIMLIPVFMMFS